MRWLLGAALAGIILITSCAPTPGGYAASGDIDWRPAMLERQRPGEQDRSTCCRYLPIERGDQR